MKDENRVETYEPARSDTAEEGGNSEDNAEKEMNHFLATFLSIKIDKVPKSEEKYAIKIQKLEEIRNWNKEQMLIEQEQDRKDKECEAASISKENQSDD